LPVPAGEGYRSLKVVDNRHLGGRKPDAGEEDRRKTDKMVKRAHYRAADENDVEREDTRKGGGKQGFGGVAGRVAYSHRGGDMADATSASTYTANTIDCSSQAKSSGFLTHRV